MAKPEGIKEIVNHVAIQEAMAVMMMTLRDAEAGPQPTIAASYREPQRQRHGGPILVKPAFDWDAQDRYVRHSGN